MEAKCLSKTRQRSSDIISTLPQSIIETILCLLPIQEAARTSILSTEWRYKWTTIPKLVFNSSVVFGRGKKNMDERCKLFYAIYQVLLLRKGPILEFTLHMSADRHCFEIDQILQHLSMNHALKKLTLKLANMSYKLPLCAYSLHQLTDLDLRYISLDHQPIFSGFGNLRSLCLYDVSISIKALLRLLSNCPSLTSFKLFTNELFGDKDYTIIELFECLPMIEYLYVSLDSLLQIRVVDSVPKELSTSLIHLQYVCLQDIWLVDDELRFLIILIKCSPNLEKIRLESCNFDGDYDGICSSILEEYPDVWLEHLNELEIEYFCNKIHEMEFVKFILARSPKLKNIRISSDVETDQERLEMLKVLLKAPRVSPVEIVVK